MTRCYQLAPLAPIAPCCPFMSLLFYLSSPEPGPAQRTGPLLEDSSFSCFGGGGQLLGLCEEAILIV